MIVVLIVFSISGYSQVDTISENLYQLEGRIGIGQVNSGGYFNPLLALRDGWLQIADSTDHDAGLVVFHQHRFGYGFARNVNMVFEGVNGDPYTEFRIRDTWDEYTASSWAIGPCNQDEDKLIISNDTYTLTGASPSIGNRIMTMKLTGEVGIGTSEPVSRLQIADGDIYISDIDRGIIMKSPDGQCWRGTLDNNGSLKFSLINCPDFSVVVPETSEIKEYIMIFPNPAENKVYIGIKEKELKDLRFSIFDLTGGMIISGKIKSTLEIVDITDLQAGTYIIKVNDTAGKLVTTEKIIKK